MTSRFTATHMVNGMMRVLAERGYSSFLVSTNVVDEAFEHAFECLTELAPKYDLNVRFRIARDDFGESQVVRAALNAASQRDVVSFDNPEYQDMRMDRQKVSSTVRFESLPGERELYERLCDAFLAVYESTPNTEDLTNA